MVRFLYRTALLTALLTAPLSSTATLAGSPDDGWRRGALLYSPSLADARRRGAPLLVYFAGRCDGCARPPLAGFLAPERRRLLRHAVKLHVDPAAGPAARRLAREYGAGPAATLFVVLPGSGLGPQRTTPADAGAAIAGRYLRYAERLQRQRETTRARRARRQARRYWQP